MFIFSWNSSYRNESTSSYHDYLDNHYNDLPKPPPLMSTIPAMSFSSSYDSKPSNTFERLQMFLQNRTTISYENRQSSGNDYSSSSYSLNPSQNSDNSNWSSSSRYSS